MFQKHFRNTIKTKISRNWGEKCKYLNCRLNVKQMQLGTSWLSSMLINQVIKKYKIPEKLWIPIALYCKQNLVWIILETSAFKLSKIWRLFNCNKQCILVRVMVLCSLRNVKCVLFWKKRQDCNCIRIHLY